MHRRHDHRSIHFAVLASLALHAAVLMTSPSLRGSTKAALNPAPIMARLVEPAPVAAPAPAERLPRAEKPRPRVAKPLPEPKSASIASEEPKSPDAGRGESVATIESQPAPSTPSVDAEADSLAKFRLEIIALARRLKRYPPLAIDNNWQGTAHVRVSFAEGGRSSVAVVKSSGHDVLDKQAIDLITRALPPLPPLLRGREFALEIPVIYNLEEAGRG